MRQLYVQGVITMGIFVNRCPKCGELTIQGGWEQLPRVFDVARMRVVVTLDCEGCGDVRRRAYRLTTGRADRRLSWWLGGQLTYLPFLILRWRRFAPKLVMWLATRSMRLGERLRR